MKNMTIKDKLNMLAHFAMNDAELKRQGMTSDDIRSLEKDISEYIDKQQEALNLFIQMFEIKDCYEIGPGEFRLEYDSSSCDMLREEAELIESMLFKNAEYAFNKNLHKNNNRS